MEIKKYTCMPDDAREIRKIVFVEEQGFVDEFDQYDEEGQGFHLVMYEDGKAVACCRYFRVSIPDGYKLGRMAVVREARGRHLGQKMMTFAENDIENMGGKLLSVSAQLHARGFYEKQGFQVSGDEYREQGAPHIRMVKELGD